MKTKLIYLVVFRWLPSRPASGYEWRTKYQEVDAGKEFERALKDRLAGKDMKKSKSNNTWL